MDRRPQRVVCAKRVQDPRREQDRLEEGQCLYGFDCENCRAYRLLCEKLKEPNKSKLTRNMILAIAEVVEGIPLPREAYGKRA